MLDFPRWKQVFYWAIALIAMVASLPSLAAFSNLAWPSMLPAPEVNLGLDLAGGSHILLEANPDQVRSQRLEGMDEDVRQRLKQNAPDVQIGDISTRDGTVSFMVQNPGQVDQAPSHRGRR